MNKALGVSAVFIASLLYGSYGIWSVLIGKEFGIFFQSYARALIVLAIIVPIVVWFVKWKRILRSDYSIFFILCLLGVFTQAPIYYAYQNAGVGIASIFFFTAYLIAQYVIGTFVFREKIGLIKVVSFCLAILGAYLVLVNDIHVFALLAVAMAVLAGASGGAQVALTKLVSEKYSSLQISVFTWSAVVISALPLSLYLAETQHIPTISVSWIYLLLFSISGLLTFVLIIYGYKRVEASVGGLIGLLEIVFAVVFGWLFFGEQITPTIFFGSTIILFAAMLPDLSRLLKPKKIPTT